VFVSSKGWKATVKPGTNQNNSENASWFVAVNLSASLGRSRQREATAVFRNFLALEGNGHGGFQHAGTVKTAAVENNTATRKPALVRMPANAMNRDRPSPIASKV
jgi:hypothetical protein